MSEEEIEKTEELYCEQLKKMRDWFGDWSKVRDLLKTLEDNDNEAAYDRYYES